MLRLSFLAIVLLFFTSAQTPSRTEWRGLAPITSTRMDVERTLGPPSEESHDKRVLTYFLPDVVVDFWFSNNPKCQQKLSYSSWDVMPGTVTGINVRFKRQPLIDELGIDLTKYKKIQMNSDLIGHQFYVHPDEGFGIETGLKYVTAYQYGPSGKQKHLQCPRASENP